MTTARNEAVDTEAKAKTLRKSELTRGKIVEAALALFAEHGFEDTTMRLIAERAGVSVGNAYYYFKSKEDLMQAYYQSLFEMYAVNVAPVLETETDFVARLTKVSQTWIDTARPYHSFAGAFFRTAADPNSPLSPFSEESGPTRDAMTAVFQQVIDGSKKLKASEEVRERLAQLLWLYHMGVVLYWVYDKSEEQAESKLLIERTAPLIGQLVGLSRLPVLRGSAKDFMDLLDVLTKRPHPTDQR